MVNRLLHGSLMIQYHHKLMPFAWSIFIDISIFAAIYSHKPFAFAVHVIGAVLTGIITIATSFSSFLKGIPPVGNPMRLHKQIGTFLYMLIVSQIAIGILWYFMKSSLKKSKLSLIFKKIHKIVGYSIALVAKFQVLYILQSDSFLFWLNLLWDLTTVLFLIKKKRSKAKSEGNPQLKLMNASYRTIKTIEDISFQYPNIFLYGNYVFNCQSMKNKHPAGFQVIFQSKDHCIDRYIYGMFSPENLPSIKPHSHTPKSLAMLTHPIAKLQVPQQFLNMAQQSFQVKICSVDSICSKSCLFSIRMRILQNEAIEYNGYSQISQLGRYYSLTFNQQMTRLYSTVNFIMNENINFMHRVIPSIALPIKMKSLTDLQEQGQLKEVTSEQLHSKETMIPLVIKKYNNGRFTKKLFQSQAKVLKLSCSKGRGLQLAKVQFGRIVLVSAGTGLLPFCDLIDLLFKQQLIKQQPQYKDEVLSKNKILRTPFLQSSMFTFVIAVNYLSQIHPIILNQLIYLADISDRFEVFLRAKDLSGFDLRKIKIENGIFEAIVEQKIRAQHISKVLVCGTFGLNISLRKLMDRLNFKQFLIL